MNPSVSQAFIDEEYERDPVSAAAEYGAEFRSDIAEFVSMDVLDACTADGVFELPPISGASYVAFVDLSGGSSDSMTLAIARLALEYWIAFAKSGRHFRLSPLSMNFARCLRAITFTRFAAIDMLANGRVSRSGSAMSHTS